MFCNRLTMTKPIVKLNSIILCSVAAITLAVLYLVWIGRIRPYDSRVLTFAGLSSVPTISFDELRHTKPFLATVQEKRIGTWNAVIDSSTGRSEDGGVRTKYILVYLSKSNNMQIALYEENPNSDDLAALLSLRDGQAYSFPGALSASSGSSHR